jgi:uncharacterized membrane protein
MWHSLGTTMASSFLASLVESVEALTVILAVGSTRGWRPTLIGGVAALVVLVVIVALFGGALARVPLNALQLVMGALLILFGLRWLQKAALRAAGLIPLHDEAQIFRDEQRRLQTMGLRTGWDGVAFATAFQITILEGTEVVFVVIGLSAGSSRLLQGASMGAAGALILVAAAGALIHRPLAKVPENQLKLVVAVLLSAFGAFWFGEGLGLSWPGGHAALLVLIAAFAVVAAGTLWGCIGIRDGTDRRELQGRSR